MDDNLVNSNIIALKKNTEPGDLAAERVLLGCLIVDNNIIAEVSATIYPESFFKVSHQYIYAEMLSLYQSGIAIDEVTLGNKLRESGNLEKAGGYGYISELRQLVPVNYHAADYAKIIQNHHYMRKIMDITREISRRSADPTENLQNILGDLEKQISTIHGLQQQKNFLPLKDALTSVIETLEHRSRNLDSLIGLESGFIELDEVTMGLQPSDLIILAARPSMGKTALALNIAAHASLNLGQTVFFFSLEMSKEQVALRLLGAEAEISSNDLKRGNLQPQQWKKVMEVSEKLSKAPFFISDVAGMTILDMVTLAKAAAVENPPQLIIIDYLQLIRSISRNNNREQEIADISRTLKSLAKNLNIPLIALSQLNRGPEIRANKRPNMADIRESGAIEQDADLILFLYRDEVYNPKSLDQGIAELIISKHRNGQIGTHKLAFFGEYTKFCNLSEQPSGADKFMPI